MTDDEPEPFRMPTDPDAEEPAAPDDDEPEGDAADEGPRARAESIADLIDEAARTAAEQDQAEERGNVPQDRSADVWGEPAEAPVHGTDAVWQQAEDDASSNVWDLDEDDDMWGSAGAPIHEQAPADEPTPPPAARAPGADAEGEHDQHDEHDEEPETFTFPAGPDTTAPAELPDHTADEDEEPEAFTFAVTDDQPPASAQPAASAQPPGPAGGTAAAADEVQEWTVPGADDDEEADVNDEVWTFSVATDQETPLADSASPRDDAGWHDLEAEQEPGWEMSDLSARAGGPEEEPAAFTAAIQAHEDDEDDDAPWTSPALPDAEPDAPPARAATAEVQEALGDLLDSGDQDAAVEAGGPVAPAATTPAATTPAAAAPTPDDVAGDAGLDDFDHLDELDDLDDLDHLDDMAAAAVPGVGHGVGHGDRDDAAGDVEHVEHVEDVEHVEHVEEEAAEVDQPLDAPTAARQVMAPGAVTFSSSGKKKKRGLFG